ncbi:MAG: hypothetical protein PHC61_12100 [Chitinivibrionales bacterium]|nr:hypothetical protein [Chitinivibrionales bacterium]
MNISNVNSNSALFKAQTPSVIVPAFKVAIPPAAADGANTPVPVLSPVVVQARSTPLNVQTPITPAIAQTPAAAAPPVISILDNAEPTIAPIANQTTDQTDALNPADAAIVVPPLTAFNALGSEATDANNVLEDDPSEIGGHGEVTSVEPPLSAQNNTAAETTKAVRGAFPAQARRITGKRVLDYVNTVKKRAQMTNQQFERQHLPYRLNVYTAANENVLIDLSIFDKKGNVLGHSTRNVTNENFGRLMDDISSGKGLLIDDVPQRS